MLRRGKTGYDAGARHVPRCTSPCATDLTSPPIARAAVVTEFFGPVVMTSRREIAGSLIGGIKETQEMLDFCGQHNLTADVEVIPIQKVNEAYERLVRSDVKYRFCIDMASLRAQ